MTVLTKASLFQKKNSDKASLVIDNVESGHGNLKVLLRGAEERRRELLWLLLASLTTAAVVCAGLQQVWQQWQSEPEPPLCPAEPVAPLHTYRGFRASCLVPLVSEEDGDFLVPGDDPCNECGWGERDGDTPWWRNLDRVTSPAAPDAAAPALDQLMELQAPHRVLRVWARTVPSPASPALYVHHHRLNFTGIMTAERCFLTSLWLGMAGLVLPDSLLQSEGWPEEEAEEEFDPPTDCSDRLVRAELPALPPDLVPAELRDVCPPHLPVYTLLEVEDEDCQRASADETVDTHDVEKVNAGNETHAGRGARAVNQTHDVDEMEAVLRTRLAWPATDTLLVHYVGGLHLLRVTNVRALQRYERHERSRARN